MTTRFKSVIYASRLRGASQHTQPAGHVPNRSLTIYNKTMTKKKSKIPSTFKAKKPHERRIADDLVKQHEKNEKLKNKEINKNILDLFK